MSGRGLPLYILAWAAALLPFVTTHVSYLIAASGGHVDWCVPYWDACTSISATGRQLPEKIWFKLGMMPAAVVTALLWWSLWRWLKISTAREHRLACQSMLVLGVLAAFFLILYTAALGEEGDYYQRIRRTGITLSFAFTYLAQLMFTRLLGRMGTTTNHGLYAAWRKRLLAMLVLLLAVGITSVMLDIWLAEGYDAYEDAFEWHLALLLNAWFAGLALMLHHIPVSLEIASKNGR